ncbi:biliverdin-producing heme oxygenase [Halostreptopolyspora alba]|uniref:Biliverdin-producing heme oxygenase n=1 Tax=Halostreptopolyspora alba TaxID=2487137 RepID=A0A3N0ECE2_9ACTN|nr:biliverdin-producing heme oxygenase [Nocardiopsaceae bacterium YIM 96095]
METGAAHPRPPNDDTGDTLSAWLKAATWGEHQQAERQPFVQALVEGRLPSAGYAAMVAQHYAIYRALEEVGHALTSDPVAGRVLFPELVRTPALERDLAALHGPGWRTHTDPDTALTPAARTYVARLRQMVDHPAGYVAHHYTRYLGDLSGGQFIRDSVVRAYGLADGGATFYDFDRIASIPRFKRDYRSRIDALGLDEAGRRQLVSEARLAYQLNIELLADLGRGYLPELVS